MKRQRKSPRGITAWLVTWEHAGAHAAPPERVAAVFSSRVSPLKILGCVEWLYANEVFDLSERIAHAKSRERFNPYPARFGFLEGMQWEGEIYCGHNPYLFARIVDDLKVTTESEVDQAIWKERPKPTISSRTRSNDVAPLDR